MLTKHSTVLKSIMIGAESRGCEQETVYCHLHQTYALLYPFLFTVFLKTLG